MPAHDEAAGASENEAYGEASLTRSHRDPAASVFSPYIIAEIGSSHHGELSKGKELVHAMAEAGADCAKFQIIYADEIIHPRTGIVTFRKGPSVPLYERFSALERGFEFYAALQEECRHANIDFLVSIFGMRGLNLAMRLGLGQIKIASPELNHIPLLRAVAAARTEGDRAAADGALFHRVILSTGVSTLTEIEEALAVVGTDRAVLLHCVTSYPAPEEEYNLRLIPHLGAICGVPIGLSDHTTDAQLVPAIGAAVGAAMIEKHCRLERGGLDDAVALEPVQFASMVQSVRRYADMDAGKPETLDALYEEFGRRRVEAVCGDGIKRLALSEAENYGRTNRSIHAVRDLGAGERIDEDTCAVLRTERNLPPGIAPRFWDTIRGCHLRRAVASGQGIVWEDLLE